MRLQSAWLAAALAVFCFHAPAVPCREAAAEPVRVKAGFAERDITPAAGAEMPGNYGKTFGTGVHDPCKVRAAVFDDGSRRVALVGLDALEVPRQAVLEARRLIFERCGIPPEAVLVGASHSHSSGPICMVQPGEFDHASPLVRKLAYELSSTADAAYVQRVVQEIAGAVCAAYGSRVEARLSFGSGREDKVSFNRRLRMKNGRTFSHPGRGNPDIIGYAGPIDPEVGVIGAWDLNGRFIGCVVNFANHATSSPGGFSANWICYLEKTIRGGMETDAPVVFLQGCCGDITPEDNLSPYASIPGEKQARWVGGRVGAEAVKVLAAAEPGTEVAVDARSRVWKIRRRAPAPERVARCLETVQKLAPDAGSTEWIFAKEIVLLDAMMAREPEVEVEVQAVQVGPAVLVSNPAELFVEFGLDLKKGSPFPFTWPVELANGCVGYVPTEEALSGTGGGYETRLTSYSNLVPSAGGQFVEAGLDLMRQMKPGRAFAPPPAPPFREPWSYGNVPPELR